MLNDVNNFIKCLALKAFIINEVSIANFFFIFQYESYFLLGHFYFNCPANIRLYEDVLKTSYIFVFKTSSRRLDQDEYVRLSLTSSEGVFKTSSKCFQDVLKTSSRHLQDVFKTSSRRP